MKNVLILSAGRRVELVHAFQHELRQRIPDAQVITADSRPELSAACQVVSQSFPLPRCDAAEYAEALRELCGQHGIGLVVPTIDTELPFLAQMRQRFHDDGIELLVSDPALITATSDKRLVPAVFAEIDITTPALMERDALTFPCFVKPYDGSSGVGARLIRHRDDLTEAELRDPKLVFMAYIDREHVEYTIDCYYTRDGLLRCVVPRERLEVRGGEVSKGITRRNAVYDRLYPRLERLQGARGCVTVQVFHHPRTDHIVGVEINPRFGGGFPLAYSAGANFPAWAIEEYLQGRRPQVWDGWESNLLMLRYDAKVLVSRTRGTQVSGLR